MKPEIKLLLILMIMSAFRGEAITIEGFEPDYANCNLEFITLADPVSKSGKSLFILQIDTKGNFYAEAEITRNIFCYSDFGIFRGRLILVPGRNIKIILPPRRDKNFGESKNPYFEPVEIWLKVEDGTGKELTNLVSRFDNRFYQMTDKYFNQLYYSQLNNYVDTVNTVLNREFPENSDRYLSLHRECRMASLEAGITRTGREKLAGKLNDISPEDWNQPAFIDFINQLFVNTLSNESKSVSGSGIKQWIVRKNTGELKRWTDNFTASASPLSDLILIKMLHDAFYSGEFSRSAILQILQSGYFSHHSQSEIRLASSEVYAKLNFLQKGTTAPEICLPSTAMKTFCSTSVRHPYLYILFADPEIPVCLEHLKYLKTMTEKTGSALQLLIVVTASNRINIIEFMSRNQVPGIVVIDPEERPAGKKYKVRSYPSAFLLNKEHQVVLAPAKTPLDGFEFQFAGLKN